MNASDLRIVAALYRHGRNLGNGYSPSGETVEEAAAALVADGGNLLYTAGSSDELTVVAMPDRIVAIGGDAMGNGAWAVDVYRDDLAASWRQGCREAGDDDMHRRGRVVLGHMIQFCDAAIAGDLDACIRVMRAEYDSL
jgi:hypothetical protein